MKVAVIGGRGSLGSHISSTLAKAGFEVAALGRTSSPPVDITRRETLAGLESFDVVVNASDSVLAPPDELANYCLANGKLLFETAAEPLTYRRLLASSRSQPASSGSVVLGAGIFPGLSNVLAAEAARSVPDCERLELGIRWSPFSSGGGGMVNLVGHLVSVNTERRIEGQAVEGSPIEPGPTLPFPTGRRATLHLAFSEPTLLRQSTSVPNIAVYGAPGPGWLRGVFLVTPLALLKSAVMRAVMWLEFTILRRFLLAWRKTPVELVCVATSRAGKSKILSLRTHDGMACAGRAVTAMVAMALERRPTPGFHGAESLFELEPLLERMTELDAKSEPVERLAPEYQVSAA